MDFTDEQEEMIRSFQEDVQSLVVGHARNKRDAALIVDTAVFYGELCDMIAEFAANHAIDVEYPEHVTTCVDDGSGGFKEEIREVYDCTDRRQRDWWKEWLERAKKESDEKAEDGND